MIMRLGFPPEVIDPMKKVGYGGGPKGGFGDEMILPTSGDKKVVGGSKHQPEPVDIYVVNKDGKIVNTGQGNSSSPKAYVAHEAQKVLGAATPFEEAKKTPKYKRGVPVILKREENRLAVLGDVASKIMLVDDTKIPTGYDELFKWYECMRTTHVGATTALGVGCHVEWVKLFSFLMCDDFRRVWAPKGSALAVIPRNSVPIDPGYDKLVAWYECIRRACQVNRGYLPRGSIPAGNCGKEWAELHPYLVGADRRKNLETPEDFGDRFVVSDEVPPV